MESCKGCGGRKTDTYKGKVYCHFCGEELGNIPTNVIPTIHSVGAFNSWTSQVSISTSMSIGGVYADRD